MTGGRLYLDHAATTPMLLEARVAMRRGIESWANPSSPHAEGRAAGAALEDARRRVKERLGWKHDVIFTSGASEAIALAVGGLRRERQMAGATEHESVTEVMNPEAITIPVDRSGVIDSNALDEALGENGVALVAIQQVNNETGVIQPLAEILRRTRDSGGLLLADCAQGAGKLELPEADFIALSAHKLGGPPGAGALLVRDLALLKAAGGQEKGYRRGTQNLPGILAFAAAIESEAFTRAMPRLAALRARLEKEISAMGGMVIASSADRSPAIGAIAMPGVSSASQVVQFDLAGIAVSAGSACSSASLKSSRTIKAMGLAQRIADCVLRISFGPETSEPDIDRFLAEWRQIARRASACAA